MHEQKRTRLGSVPAHPRNGGNGTHIAQEISQQRIDRAVASGVQTTIEDVCAIIVILICSGAIIWLGYIPYQ